MERTDEHGKGTIVLATVRGDVHDIGKNLVDIILSNNGYTVVNLGIKQPISAILEAADEHGADVIGMSGLLVKSTMIMKENLEEMNQRGVAARWPVILGGAALTRAYVEQDLAELYAGEVRYARDAFEGLRLMDAVVAHRPRRPRDGAEPRRRAAGPTRERLVRKVARPTQTAPEQMPARSDVATDNPVPAPPFWGDRVVKGVPLADYSAYLDERALFLGQWGLRPTRGEGGRSYEDLVETDGRPRLRMWLDRLKTENLLDAGVVYGYFPCVSEGDDLVVLADPDDVDSAERCASPSRASAATGTCAWPTSSGRGTSGQVDVVAFSVVTMGARVSAATAELFAKDAYRDYLELHGLSVQLAEALAEHWHARVRDELGFGAEDDPSLDAVFRQGYRGSRYSFGYPACPDLEEQTKLFELLDPGRIGVELSEEFQLHPEQSTSAIIAHHPEAKYFNAR